MGKEAKKGYGSAIALMMLGMLALYLGAQWLLVLIPIALLFWFGIEPTKGSRRN
jgi:hypothetical protein